MTNDDPLDALVDWCAERLDRCHAWFVASLPLAAFVVEFVVAAALVTGVCAGAGTILEVGREKQDATSLIASAADRREFTHEAARRRAAFSPDGELRRGKRDEARASIRRMEVIAEAAGLRNCERRRRSEGDPIPTTRPALSVECDGTQVDDGTAVVAFWAALLVCALVLGSWVGYQLQESWMLPHHNPGLWFTPAYATIVALLLCGPFLMMDIYYGRAADDYFIAPDPYAPSQPGLLLYAVIVLQVTAVATAAIKARIDPAAGAGAAVLTVTLPAALIVFADDPTSFVRILVLLAAIAGAIGLLIDLKNVPVERPSELTPEFVSTARDFSRHLVPAWTVVVCSHLLSAVGAKGWWIQIPLALAGAAACLSYVLRSHAVELDSQSGPLRAAI